MMSLDIIAILALCTAAAAILMLCRFGGLRTVLKYAAAVDVAFTVALVVMFSGTLGGMLVAVMAGLFLSLFLTLCKRVVALTEPKHNDTEFDAQGNWVYNEAPYV